MQVQQRLARPIPLDSLNVKSSAPVAERVRRGAKFSREFSSSCHGLRAVPPAAFNVSPAAATLAASGNAHPLGVNSALRAVDQSLVGAQAPASKAGAAAGAGVRAKKPRLTPPAKLSGVHARILHAMWARYAFDAVKRGAAEVGTSLSSLRDDRVANQRLKMMWPDASASVPKLGTGGSAAGAGTSTTSEQSLSAEAVTKFLQRPRAKNSLFDWRFAYATGTLPVLQCARAHTHARAHAYAPAHAHMVAHGFHARMQYFAVLLRLTAWVKAVWFGMMDRSAGHCGRLPRPTYPLA